MYSFKRCCCVTVFSSILLMLASIGLARANPTIPYIIYSPKVAAQAQEFLSARTLDDIFTLRQRRWPNGTKIRIFLPPADSEVYQQFITHQLGMSVLQIEGIWNRMTFSGRAIPPSILPSQNDVWERVQQSDAAIGVVSKQFATQQLLQQGNQ